MPIVRLLQRQQETGFSHTNKEAILSAMGENIRAYGLLANRKP